MSPRVYVHIGAPKTGTTYLQERLALNAKELAEHDIHFPTRLPVSSPTLFHFRAALDLLGQDWGGPAGHADGSWEAMVRRVRRRSGTVIISHEILAPASAEAIARLKRDLAKCELHIVYSARDLGRQIPAAWQESVKQGRTWRYARFLRRLEQGRLWFYRAFDLPAVLSAWSAGLPPERVHVLTVPHGKAGAGDHSNLLWQRFCGLVGIEEAWAPHDTDRANHSLGMAETQVIRRLNRRIERSTRDAAIYDDLIRELLAETELVNRRSAPVRLPPSMATWADQEAERWIEWATGSGIDVVGDLEELRPRRPAEGTVWVDPDRVSAKRQLSAALDALTTMTREAARRPNPELQLAAKVRTRAKLFRGQ